MQARWAYTDSSNDLRVSRGRQTARNAFLLSLLLVFKARLLLRAQPSACSLQCSVERFKGHFVNYGSLTHSRMRSRGASATVRSQHGVIENGRDFNALPVARGKVTGRCPQIACFVEGKYIRSVAAKRPLTSLTPLPLDQTGSRSQWQTLYILLVHFSWES